MTLNEREYYEHLPSGLNVTSECEELRTKFADWDGTWQ